MFENIECCWRWWESAHPSVRPSVDSQKLPRLTLKTSLGWFFQPREVLGSTEGGLRIRRSIFQRPWGPPKLWPIQLIMPLMPPWGWSFLLHFASVCEVDRVFWTSFSNLTMHFSILVCAVQVSSKKRNKLWTQITNRDYKLKCRWTKLHGFGA